MSFSTLNGRKVKNISQIFIFRIDNDHQIPWKVDNAEVFRYMVITLSYEAF